ncbi:hypothetical protein [Desulfogranum marinum]|uniref:hypothetical protein n=1 Tax=Desulfogranum marinum TaxID=453220 RepID=UPI0029C8F8E8|nr:hypothetical protein [Desulfogranum marinum]
MKRRDNKQNLLSKAVASAFLVASLAGSVMSANATEDTIVPLPKDDVDIKLLRYEGTLANRYTEIFLIGGNATTKELKGGVYQTIGLNDPKETGDTAPAEILDKMDMKALAQEYNLLGAYKNGPRQWTLDWVEVKVGKQRNFQGLDARWVMWLDVPEHLGGSQDKMSYRPITGKRDTHFGINKGTRVYLLDDPEGNTYCMKSMSQILDPDQSYESLKDLGSKLKLAEGWKFRTKILEQDLILTPNNGKCLICQDDFGNTYDRTGGPYSNYKP